jgi:hypothetical protein
VSPLYLYDDVVARAFEPFALTRPAGELRAGAALVRERWCRALRLPAAGFVGAPHLAGFTEGDAPPATAGELPAGAVVVNTRCVLRLDTAVADAGAWTVDGRVAAVRLREPLPVDRLADGTLDLATLVPAGAATAALDGWWLAAVWDLVGQLQQHLLVDIAALGPTLDCVEHPGAVLGAHPVYVERGATVEPHVVFDTSRGPCCSDAAPRCTPSRAWPARATWASTRWSPRTA